MSENAKRKPEETDEGAELKRPAIGEQEAATDNEAPAEQAAASEDKDGKAEENQESATETNDEQANDTNNESEQASGSIAIDGETPSTPTIENASERNEEIAPSVPPLPTDQDPQNAQPLIGDAPPGVQPVFNQAPSADGQMADTIAVPEYQVQGVVGQDGSNMQQLEAMSGAQITVPAECDPGTGYRTFTIRGSAESVRYCKHMLEQKLREDLGQAAPAATAAPATAETLTRVTYIPNDHVGRVIGRQGATIRQIQELSGAHMDIAKECRPGQNQREVTVSGTPAQVQLCEELIHKKVAGESLPVAQTRTGNECLITIPDEMVGRIIGKGGSTIRELQDGSGAHMDIAKAPNAMNRREIIIRGQPQQIAYCIFLINTKIADLTGDYTRNFVDGPPEMLTAAANMGTVYTQLQRQQQLLQQTTPYAQNYTQTGTQASQVTQGTPQQAYNQAYAYGQQPFYQYGQQDATAFSAAQTAQAQPQQPAQQQQQAYYAQYAQQGYDMSAYYQQQQQQQQQQ
eukprot:gene6403-283_t